MIKKVLLGILIAAGVVFLLLMFLPDDEEASEDRPREETDVAAGEETDVAVQKEEREGAAGGKRATVETVSIGTDAKSATVMVYMNGSDLETEAGEASTDISEMLSSGIGDRVNVIVQTMGTRDWQDHDISSKTAQTWRVENGKLVLVRDGLSSWTARERIRWRSLSATAGPTTRRSATCLCSGITAAGRSTASDTINGRMRRTV